MPLLRHRDSPARGSDVHASRVVASGYFGTAICCFLSHVSHMKRCLIMLAGEDFTQTKLFAGIQFNWLANLAFEVDKTGDDTSVGMKLGFRF